jgi:hypothetical protein
MEAPCQTLFDLARDTARLTVESGHVIGLRLAVAAKGGPHAMGEASRMISEKAQAAFDAQFLVADCLLRGQPHLAATKAVALYLERVQANRDRLTQFA